EGQAVQKAQVADFRLCRYGRQDTGKNLGKIAAFPLDSLGLIAASLLLIIRLTKGTLHEHSRI
ncbi:hypothetical protein, partial [Parasphingorhabdus sp.]|uniref:hypothetical protein n=1 Tax=Parasphingorhabdus sp. TaxID=2709688 RepID=UPI003264FAE0